MDQRTKLVRLLISSPYLYVLDKENWRLAADHLLSNGVIVPTVDTIEWFSVFDQLPGEKGTYLTVTEKGAVRTNHYYGNHEWGYGNDCLYWAYMPDPPPMITKNEEGT